MKYYPLNRIVTGSRTTGNEFAVDGKPYVGPYYQTYTNEYYTGVDPVSGDNKKLVPISAIRNDNNYSQTESTVAYNGVKNIQPADVFGFIEIIPSYPKPTDLDYGRGFFYRYFAKKRLENGGLIETTQDVFDSLQNPGSEYNYEMFHCIQLYWQLTGPLRDTINTVNGVRTAGIQNTNQRLTEQKDKNFRGLVTFIGGNYSKFAKPS